ALFRLVRFFVEERFAELRFLPAVRLVDFLVAAIWSLDRRVTGGRHSPPPGGVPKLGPLGEFRRSADHPLWGGSQT
ncbi:MAG TPA: hypothetical protein VGC48_06200, partial [Gemmatimonadales bacterium]